MSGSEKSDFSDALAVGRALDLILPDSRPVRDAYAQAQAESEPWLFNHGGVGFPARDIQPTEGLGRGAMAEPVLLE